MAERFDIVIFGASGFTGKYVVKELNKIATQNKPLTWAIAGRSEEKLKSILNEFEEKIDINVKIIIADVNDEESLKKMSEQAKIIVNCCGPYRFFGEPVVKACIATGTHHVDVTGEPQYMEQMQLEYHTAAQERGVYIISSCGFDSIPFDLGVVYLQDKFDGTVNSVDTYMNIQMPANIGGARVHYATWESAVYGLAHYNELRPLRTKLYPEPLPEFKPKAKALPLIHKSPIVNNSWAIPYPGPEKSVAIRSQRYFYDQEKKRPVQLHSYMTVPSLIMGVAIAIFGFVFVMLTKFHFGRYLLLNYPRFFSFGWTSHEGPSDELLQNTKFSVTIVGKGWSSDKSLPEPTDQHVDLPNKTVITKMTGVDLGYSGTAIMVLRCALMILKEADKMPNKGGVYPPGAAYAKTSLIEQLNRNGITFELISSNVE